MKNYILYATVAGMIAFSPLAAQAQIAPEDVWENAESSVVDIMEARSKDEFAETSDKDSAKYRRIQHMINAAVDILATSEMKNLRENIERITSDIASKRAEIQRLERERVDAPESAGGIVDTVLENLPIAAKKTKTWYSNEIEKVSNDIQDLQAEEKGLRAEFIDGLQAIGIPLTDDQLNGLMTMATAGQLIDMQAAFANMKAINNGLLNATINTNESIDVAKRYYGIYAIMLEIALYMHEDFIDTVDNKYVVKLKEIVDRSNTLTEQSRKMLRGETDEGLMKTLEGNISAQNLTRKVAGLYQDRLIEQRDQIKRSAFKISKQHRVAVNTWKTVDLSANLIAMMKNSGKAFGELMEMDIPAIRPFESKEMQFEFESLTAQITQE